MLALAAGLAASCRGMLTGSAQRCGRGAQAGLAWALAGAHPEPDPGRGRHLRGAIARPINRDRIVRAGLIPAHTGSVIVAIASGQGAVPNVGADPACDPGVAFWKTGRLVIRTMKRQPGSGVRRWGV